MSEKNPTMAASLYDVHRHEAEAVVDAHASVYRAYYKAHVELYGADGALVKRAVNDAHWSVSRLGIKHELMAYGLRRNADDFHRVEADYMQEALDDATAQGYQIEGWTPES